MQQSAEYFCSLEHRLKRFPCLGEAGKQSELAFCLFFFALDVVELCMMVTVMQFIYFFTVSCTALTWKASEISTLCILPATQQKPNKRKKCDGLFPMFPQIAEQQMQMMATSKQLQSHGNNKLYLPGGADCFVFLFLNLAFIIFILHFVYYHFHQCAKLFNKSIKIC